MNNRKTEAARAEIRAVLEPIKQTVLTEISKVQAEIRGGTEAIGAVAFAGEKATEWGLTGWNRYDALNAAFRMFKDWLQAFGGEEDREPRKMVEQIQAWIQANAGTRLEDWRRPSLTDTHAPRTMNRADWKRPTAATASLHEKDQVFEYLIYPAAFKGELCSGFDPAQVCRELLKRDLLHKGDGQNVPVKIREPGAASTSRLYLITPAILEWSDDHA